jgi:hypothetical protein
LLYKPVLLLLYSTACFSWKHAIIEIPNRKRAEELKLLSSFSFKFQFHVKTQEPNRKRAE